jgi:hypothetical protein
MIYDSRFTIWRKRAGLALALFSILNPHLSTAFAQGSLTPPGAPAPTMKTLSQVEPRIPIASAPITLPAPGSYYLTTNVTVSSGNAITINANNVTLDLNGFTISSTETPAANGIGISLNGVTNIVICNGQIGGGVTNNGGVYSGSGFGYGIYFSVIPYNVRVSGVSVFGCQYSGIYLSRFSTVVESCVVNTVGGSGIIAQSVSDSTAMNCGSDAMFVVNANNCSGASYNGTGIDATVANNCYGSSVINHGVIADTANNCEGYAPGTGHGILATTANNCYGLASGGGNGVSVTTAMNCYGSAAGSGNGVVANTANNCYGDAAGSGNGIYAYNVAMGCYGQSSTGTAINAYNAAFCNGYRPGGTAIQATIANGCIASGGTNVITYKYNMP